MERLTLRVAEKDLLHLERLVDAGANTNRSEGIREALERYIESAAKEDNEVKDNIVNMYLNDLIEFSDLERLIGYEKAREIKETTENR